MTGLSFALCPTRFDLQKRYGLQILDVIYPQRVKQVGFTNLIQ
jgi:hypothetical protein